LAPGQVDVWAWRLDGVACGRGSLWRVVAPEEAAHAAGLPEGPARERFMLARAVRRAILARYLKLAPQALRFTPGARGKPGVAGGGVRFSASRRDGMALLAVCADAEVGADLERLNALPDADAVLRGLGSPVEIAAYAGMEAVARLNAFYCWWTSKEALLKAAGAGLTVALNAFDVSLDAEAPALLASRANALTGAWSLITVAPCDGYAGTGAMQGAPHDVRAWRVSPDQLNL
jgi:4'-phosphopantetheinyl transferase